MNQFSSLSGKGIKAVLISLLLNEVRGPGGVLYLQALAGEHDPLYSHTILQIQIFISTLQSSSTHNTLSSSGQNFSTEIIRPTISPKQLHFFKITEKVCSCEAEESLAFLFSSSVGAMNPDRTISTHSSTH